MSKTTKPLSPTALAPPADAPLAPNPDPHHSPAGGTIPAAIFGIIKAMVGPAILYLPHGFSTAGWMVALPIMGISTGMYLWSSRCLLETWRVEVEKEDNKGVGGDGEDVEMVRLVSGGDAELKLRPVGGGGSASSSSGDEDGVDSNEADKRRLAATSDDPLQENKRQTTPSSSRRRPISYPILATRAHGPRFNAFVSTGIALMQCGVCLTYLIFVPQTLHSVLLRLCNRDVPLPLLLLLMVLIEVPLCWIRDIRRLTPTNILANGLIGYGLVVCLFLAIRGAVQRAQEDVIVDTLAGPGDGGNERPTDNGGVGFWSLGVSALRGDLKPVGESWYLFIGTSVLLFEGSITLLLPLQQAIHGAQSQSRFPAVYIRVILSIIAFYIFFSMTCWMAFGDDVNTILTTSLPEGNWATSVQFAYSVAVIFTFPLQSFPALEIVSRSLATSPAKKPSVLRSRSIIATVLVFTLATIAHFEMNSLGNVVSLMGSLLGCPIAFVFPPLIHNQLVLYNSSRKLSRWMNYAVAGLGVGAMVMASLTTVLTWEQTAGR